MHTRRELPAHQVTTHRLADRTFTHPPRVEILSSCPRRRKCVPTGFWRLVSRTDVVRCCSSSRLSPAISNVLTLSLRSDQASSPDWLLGGALSKSSGASANPCSSAKRQEDQKSHRIDFLEGIRNPLLLLLQLTIETHVRRRTTHALSFPRSFKQDAIDRIPRPRSHLRSNSSLVCSNAIDRPAPKGR